MRALVERIGREGPVPFSVYMETVLYGDDGFYSTGRGAGRAGRDFLTGPEVGPLFGAVVARALDGWWRELAEPDPFVVIEGGAGRGRLASDVLRASPACAPALRYVLVERSERLRAAQSALVRIEPFEDALGPVLLDDDDQPQPVPGLGPIATSLTSLPRGALAGVIVANELLDNLPFEVVERAGDAWREVRVGWDGAAFDEVIVPASEELSAAADEVADSTEVPNDARLPVPRAARAWFDEGAASLARGRLLVIDYAVSVSELATRWPGWLRTYSGHGRGSDPLEQAGTRDITGDLPLEYIVASARRAGFELLVQTDQATWLRSSGIDELVADARAMAADVAPDDLTALAARSRANEAAALLDPSGLGAHTVLVFER